MSNKKNNGFSGLSTNSFLLAFSSFFADISTEMLYPVLPIFLTQTLNAGGSVVGIVEGVAQATQNIVQGLSGYLSDRIKKRKPIALIGYILAAISKPLIGVSTVWQTVLGARFLDRLGTGTRSAPRDALIASSATDENRGKAFGLEGVGDNLGAFLGPLITVLLLFTFVTSIRHIFLLSIIPGLLAVLMISLVREKTIKLEPKPKLEFGKTKFTSSYWKYLFATAVFGIGNSSNSFLILRTRDIGVSLEATIIVYAFFNLVAALVSYPSGTLSDKLGRKNILLISFAIYAVTYFGFAFGNSVYLIGLLFILYGVFQGVFRAVGKAYATDFTAQSQRASAVGYYSATVGLSGLVASLIAGQLWDKIGHPAVFSFGAVFAILGIITLFILVPQKK